jgi:glycosyltransferase involved in cell wall biosynthesis
MHLGIRALAYARDAGVDATLTIVGDGPARGHLEELAKTLGVAPYITWWGAVPRQQLLGMYSGHDAFLFPSLRDASPTVIVEAAAHALPTICLALGGSGKMVDDTCGRVVAAENRTEADCVTELGRGIKTLAEDEELRLALSRGAIARYREFTWSNVVAQLYAVIDERLQQLHNEAPVLSPHYSLERNAS